MQFWKFWQQRNYMWWRGHSYKDTPHGNIFFHGIKFCFKQIQRLHPWNDYFASISLKSLDLSTISERMTHILWRKTDILCLWDNTWYLPDLSCNIILRISLFGVLFLHVKVQCKSAYNDSLGKASHHEFRQRKVKRQIKCYINSLVNEKQ